MAREILEKFGNHYEDIFFRESEIVITFLKRFNKIKVKPYYIYDAVRKGAIKLNTDQLLVYLDAINKTEELYGVFILENLKAILWTETLLNKIKNNEEIDHLELLIEVNLELEKREKRNAKIIKDLGLGD